MHLSMFFATFLATIFTGGLAQEGHVNLLSVASCSSRPDDLNFDFSITRVSDGKWIVSLTAEVTDAIDLNDLQYKAEAFLKKRDNYEELISLEGNLCGFIKDVLGSEWDRIRFAIIPEFGDLCKIEPGTYELNGFETNLDNTNLGALLPGGQMKILIEVNRGEDTLACAVFEFLKE